MTADTMAGVKGPTMTQSVDDLVLIQIEVVAGYEWGDPRSRVEPTDENRKAFLECQSDIAAMAEDGFLPDLPHEIDV
jgi:hypothetical protein